MFSNELFVAFCLTLFAGAATGVGSIIAFTVKRTDYRFLSVATGFSAGVMLYVSFVEILYKGGSALAERYGAKTGEWINIASFFGGILLIALIDNLIPSAENPHETHSQEDTKPLSDPEIPYSATAYFRQMSRSSQRENAHLNDKKLMRIGLFTALAIAIHNFPEGLATFLAALQNPTLGIAIAVAIALHNIPEGISVSVPIFYATGNRKKALVYSLMSGLAEPIGALVAYFAITTIFGSSNGLIPKEFLGISFGVIAGIMVYISIDELLPTSRAYGKGHDSLLGLIGGMLLMAISLVLMR